MQQVYVTLGCISVQLLHVKSSGEGCMESGLWDPVNGSGKKLLFAPLKRSALLLLLRFNLLLNQSFWVENDFTGF